MEIIIEIGSDEQKQLIAKELEFIELFEQDCQPPLQLKKVIVTSNFQATINNLENTDTYKSARGIGPNQINALARIVKLNAGFVIVLSHDLYTERHDVKTRFFIILHELYHLLNKRDFPPIPQDSYVSSLYLSNLYNLYDEYTADRFAYKTVDKIFPTNSVYWDAFIANDVEGFIALISDSQYYERIKAEIEAVRIHRNLETYFENTRQCFDEMALILIHTFSLAHHYVDKISHEDLLKSYFVNDKTFALMNYLKAKEEIRDVNLNDGMELIIEFIENFGVRFKSREDGGYAVHLDI